HGASVEHVLRAIRCGFTSVMIDGSLLPYEENVALTAEVVRLAHAVGVSVEGELGTIGQTGTSVEGGVSQVTYTDPA
ncbi:class II fructose-bisphosphate aldolase, partial [Escherichia coli]|nr:class II fructose-bisphosphate aldolase [Escherichia coli]